MNFFDILSLLGGLAMFLYGMRLMGDSLKENSSGTFKTVMEKVTDNALKAFLLGIAITALIQSSTATMSSLPAWSAPAYCPCASLWALSSART